MQPVVSIICPIRNEEKYIASCLQSLVEQTFDSSKLEILVVDGMSDDKTREIVRDFQSRYHNIHLIDNARKIVPVAMNIGIQRALGNYVLRLDGHAKAAADYVEKCVAALDSKGATGVGGPIITVNNSSTGNAISLAMSSTFGVGNSKFRTSQDEECWVDSLAFTAYKREVFTRYGLFDEELIRCQDDEYNFRIRKSGGQILLTPKIKSWYYPRASYKKLWRQYFGYGFWKVRLLQKHFWMMRWRHFVPAAFVAGLFGLAVLAFAKPYILWAFGAVIFVYLAASVMAVFSIWYRNKNVSYLKILPAFYILHFSYGFGFLWGLIRFAPRWFTRN